MPEISIIVPVYQVEKYLDRCIKSIVNQIFTDFELILVDDGSVDSSPAICDRWKLTDSRIKVIHKENGGLSSARNVGLEIASGRYIGFVDSDDWIHCNMYQMLYEMIQSGDFDIAVCGLKRVWQEELACSEKNDEDKEFVIYERNEYLCKILKVSTQDSNHYAWNKLYRRNVIINVRYPEGLIDEDVEGTFRAVLNSDRIIESHIVGYYYWYNSNSITTKKFDKQQLDFLKICDHLLELTNDYKDIYVHECAVLFRYRADLAILCKMSISEIDEKFDKKKCAMDLVKNLRVHYKILMKSSIPFSRKVLMTLFCINYNLFSKIIRCFWTIFLKKNEQNHYER